MQGGRTCTNTNTKTHTNTHTHTHERALRALALGVHPSAGHEHGHRHGSNSSAVHMRDGRAVPPTSGACLVVHRLPLNELNGHGPLGVRVVLLARRVCHGLRHTRNG